MLKNLTQAELKMIKIIEQDFDQFIYPMQTNDLYNVQAGIERLYYHPATGAPIHINDLNNDSDEEKDPEWLKDYSTMLINDFTDVNEGEKAIMNLWNMHCTRHNLVANIFVYDSCRLFIEKNWSEIKRQRLRNCCIIHFNNLYESKLFNIDKFLLLIKYLDQFLESI
jgi:polycomb protein SUZ12